MSNTIFSHRPLAGVSIGVVSDGGNLYFAAALVNDGTSRNHIFHTDRRDTFSRVRARNIVNGRIETMRSGTDVTFGVRFDTTMSQQDFMRSFREAFKPEVDETDDFLVNESDFEGSGVPIRFRADANEIWNRVSNLANDIVVNAGVSA